MKCKIFFLTCVLLANLFTFAQDKPVIAVMQLDSKHIADDKLVVLTNRLQSELYRTNRFILLERTRIDQITEEVGFQQTGFVEVNQAVKIGNMLGAEKIVTGHIEEIDNAFTIDVRLVDIQTGRIDKIAQEDFSLICDYDFVLSFGMEKAARILADLEIEKDYKKIARDYFESKMDPGIRVSACISYNKNADGDEGAMKQLIGLSMALESSSQGLGSFVGFTLYSWDQWYNEWDGIFELDIGCHYKYKYFRVYSGLAWQAMYLKKLDRIVGNTWHYESNKSISFLNFGYEYGCEFVIKVHMLTDVFIRYKGFSYFTHLRKEGIYIKDNNFSTFILGVKFVPHFMLVK